MDFDKDLDYTNYIKYKNKYLQLKAIQIGGDNTGYTNEGDMKTRQLSHIINCNTEGVNNKALNQFRFARELERTEAGVKPTGRFRFDYNCLNTASNKPIEQHQTKPNDYGYGSTIYLDRHNVKCPDSSAITNFNLVVDDVAKKMNYDFGCKNVNLQNLTKHETAFNDNGKGANNIFRSSQCSMSAWSVIESIRFTTQLERTG